MQIIIKLAKDTDPTTFVNKERTYGLTKAKIQEITIDFFKELFDKYQAQPMHSDTDDDDDDDDDEDGDD